MYLCTTIWISIERLMTFVCRLLWLLPFTLAQVLHFPDYFERSEFKFFFLFTNVFSVNLCNRKCNGKNRKILVNQYCSSKTVKMANFLCNQKNREFLVSQIDSIGNLFNGKWFKTVRNHFEGNFSFCSQYMMRNWTFDKFNLLITSEAHLFDYLGK